MTKSTTQVRTFEFDVATRASDDAIPVVVSSDAIVEMSDGPEVLVHSPDAIDLQRAPLPIIATHRGGQVNVGIVDDLHVSGGQLRGMARFGSRQEAAEYRTDVLNRIIRSVSVGYARLKGKVRSDGVLLTTRWMPTHTALVAEPADVNAGFFRSIASLPTFELDVEDQLVSPPASPATTKEPSMADQQAAVGVTDPQPHVETRALPAEPRQAIGAPEMERSRKRGIENLCKANRIDDNMRDYWIGTGMSIEQITDDLLKVIEERGKNNPQSIAKLGLTDKETQNYSIFNAVRAVVDKNWNNAGFELDASRAIAQKLGRSPDPHKFYVPFEVQQRAVPIKQRDLTVASASGGGYLVATNNMSFIEILRNRSVAFRMGARRLSGLTGSVTVPKQTAGATAVWLSSESATATESAQTFGQMALSPKTVGAYTEISRQLLLQSSPDAESIVTSDLGSVCALAVDVGVLRGSGSGGEPTGIISTGSIGTVSGTTFDYADILEFQTDVAAANVMPAAGGYVTTPAVAALAMTRSRFANTDTPLWQGNLWDGQMAGFPAMSSNQMASGTMLFGDWSQVIVGEWGVLEVEVNPYAGFQAGIIGIRALVSMDVGLRYAGAFSYGAAMT
jgi:HK97 family phage major capsid protein